MSYFEFFRAENLPVLQNRVFDTEEEALASPTGDVVLVQDQSTGLIFNSSFDQKKIEYNKSYQNEQACSEVFIAHLNDVTEIINRNFSGKSLIEVGCGKGYFLEHLKHLSYDISGIDPAYEGDNQSIIKAYFEKSLGIFSDGIVLRHVLEHMPDPVSFLTNIYTANRNSGAIYIEVPNFDWIISHNAWFDIFYEHVNYFRLSDFHRMFGNVLESGALFGGQYLYVVADLSSLRVPCYDETCRLNFPPNFLKNIEKLALLSKRNRRNVIWGGASKGVVFSLYMKRAGVSIDIVVDINPAKQGKFLACTGLEVLSPHQAMQLMQQNDSIFVMNSNYFDEIISLTGNLYLYHKVDHE